MRGLLAILATILLAYPIAFGLLSIGTVTVAAWLGFAVDVGLSTPRYGRLICYGLPGFMAVVSLCYWYCSPSFPQWRDEVRMTLRCVAFGVVLYFITLAMTVVSSLVYIFLERLHLDRESVRILIEEGISRSVVAAVIIASTSNVLTSLSPRRR